MDLCHAVDAVRDVHRRVCHGKRAVFCDAHGCRVLFGDTLAAEFAALPLVQLL